MMDRDVWCLQYYIIVTRTVRTNIFFTHAKPNGRSILATRVILFTLYYYFHSVRTEEVFDFHGTHAAPNGRPFPANQPTFVHARDPKPTSRMGDLFSNTKRHIYNIYNITKHHSDDDATRWLLAVFQTKFFKNHHESSQLTTNGPCLQGKKYWV